MSEKDDSREQGTGAAADSGAGTVAGAAIQNVEIIDDHDPMDAAFAVKMADEMMMAIYRAERRAA